MRRVVMLIAVSVLGVALVVAAGALLVPWGDRSPASRETDPIAIAERRLERLPNDWKTWAELGLAYVQRARTTGDPADYPRAGKALDRSLAIRREDNAIALTGLGALAAAGHDFPAALRHGRAALAVDPYRAAALGVVADALTELGRYDEAFATVQRMVNLRPDAASYARASYTWELRGDIGRATDAMRRALDAAPNPADGAFARLHLGQLAFGTGDLDTAAAHFTEGLRLLPGHPPLRAGLARVRAARGDTTGAVAEFRAVLTAVLEPAYAVELGDLLTATGQPEAGAREYTRAREAWAAEARNGHPPEPDPVLFAADHRDPAALDAARRLYTRQPGIGGADAMAWALRAAGRPAEALRHADEALRLGTRSALLHYHRGMILADLGKREAARAELETTLRLNPHFSARHAPEARAALVSLG
ncbi:tetratricopeptide repeat protein [Actinoplanes sp. ATCC 53533]|uniref:tetratricopeptide repeat protein n=1 Tax=Actinoplanes sp. ATCC 53533 TaxID=1288362 RepID=UPI0013159272|nr:tetratricopeptide repeat protein [Actinoplanes sp. ATCC 53533]